MKEERICHVNSKYGWTHPVLAFRQPSTIKLEILNVVWVQSSFVVTLWTITPTSPIPRRISNIRNTQTYHHKHNTFPFSLTILPPIAPYLCIIATLKAKITRKSARCIQSDTNLDVIQTSTANHSFGFPFAFRLLERAKRIRLDFHALGPFQKLHRIACSLLCGVSAWISVHTFDMLY